MAQVIDYLRDGNNDLYIINGDFAKGESTEKHTHDLVLNNPGSYSKDPVICVGIKMYLNDEEPSKVKSKIIEQLELDGQTINTIKTSGSILTEVTGEYQ